MNNIEKLEKATMIFESKVTPDLKALYTKSKKLGESVPKVLKSWSGSWFGYQSKLYYGDFEKPPTQDRFSVEWGSLHGLSDKWIERESEDVKKQLEKISTVSIDKLEEDYKSLISLIEDFYDTTSVIVRTDVEMQTEIAKEGLLEGHKKIKFGEEGLQHLKSRRPASLITRDAGVMSEGVFTPAILYYESFVKEILSNVDLVKQNIKSINYFIRWMKAKPPSIKVEVKELEPTSLYIRESIIQAIKKKNEDFNYRKLLKLIAELNKNYLDANVYSCLALIRAITDHIPPLLGYSTFEELASNYKGKKTDKDYMFNLLKDRSVSDDSLHRPISKSEDLIDMDNIPNKQFLNRLLQECMDQTVVDGFKHPKTPKQVKLQPVPVMKEPSLRPIITAALTSQSSGPEGYFVEFDLTNVGKGLAILKNINLGGVVIPYTKFTLSEKESCHIKTSNLEGTDIREGKVLMPKLEVVYENLIKEVFKTIYDIEIKNRADKKDSIGRFISPEFKDD